jgi:hypothetical protein
MGAAKTCDTSKNIDTNVSAKNFQTARFPFISLLPVVNLKMSFQKMTIQLEHELYFYRLCDKQATGEE